MERKEMESLKSEGVNRLFIVKSLPKKNVGSQRHLQLLYITI
jgi:hypothetical protein